MAMQTPKDLFIHELGDIFDAEQKIAQILPAMMQESTDAQIKKAFEEHEVETKQQINNLKECFQMLNIKPESSPCAAIAGLKQEHDSFLKEKPSDSVLNLFDLGAASKTEHYEIASYKGLIEKAELMGQTQMIELLQQNLKQEEAMAKKVETLSKRLGKQAISQS
ncbi:MAG TPA: ferritin-like domain-containing protein [Ktedonobacteraceae bacterium]|jgi:ferritin-like metal-binding protein YciE